VPTVNLFRESAGRVRYLTPDEFARLHSQVPPHLADTAMFSVMTGIRQANVKGLRCDDVDLGTKHVRVAGETFKNGRSQGFPLNEGAMAVLQQRLGQHSGSYSATKASQSPTCRPGQARLRCTEPRSKSSGGMTCATHSPPGTGRPERRRANCRCSAAGSRRPSVGHYAHIAPEVCRLPQSDSIISWLQVSKLRNYLEEVRSDITSPV
jgi:integrase